MALDKGPITSQHFLIIPIDHASCTISLSPQSQDELQEIKRGINNTLNQAYKSSLVCFERYMGFQNSIAHAIIQAVPIGLSEVKYFREKF